MTHYFISRFDVKGLWGYKNYSLKFHDDVNVIIGANASGKTTLINILYDTLTGNFSRLCRTEFEEVAVHLQSFTGNERRTVVMRQQKDSLVIAIDKKTYDVPLGAFKHFADESSFNEISFEVARRHLRFDSDLRLLHESLRELVPAVWLPVSRRLPIADEEEIARKRLHRKPLESVDECLSGLVDQLQQYRLSLNTELSELRKNFQRHALENILYDKRHDEKIYPNSEVALSDADKSALLQAFKDVGLVNREMERRIDDHFSAAEQALARWGSGGDDGRSLTTLFIIPLISRTRAIVAFAQELEAKREKLFSSLRTYVRVVNSFLNEKTVDVSDRGELVIKPNKAQRAGIDWRHLSSGEKQILILLTQAMLSEKSPVVYVADEPELSLHVSWQEKLLGALTQLAGRCQFIVATHSPDIAAGFGDRIIDLGRLKG
jgi:predicted ATP-dependent endonuclease of OLD family